MCRSAIHPRVLVPGSSEVMLDYDWLEGSESRLGAKLINGEEVSVKLVVLFFNSKSHEVS